MLLPDLADKINLPLRKRSGRTYDVLRSSYDMHALYLYVAPNDMKAVNLFDKNSLTRYFACIPSTSAHTRPVQILAGTRARQIKILDRISAGRV